MALPGRHRRYQPNRINRASLAVTAGGAGLALPLIAAGTAGAAKTTAGPEAVAGTAAHGGGRGVPRTEAPAGEEHGTVAGKALDASAHDVRPQHTPQSRAGRTEMYTVVRGDTLSGIADDQHVPGGWRPLYAANRATVGADPNLILPGQRLTLRPANALAEATRKRAKPPEQRAKAHEQHAKAPEKPAKAPAKKGGSRPKAHPQAPAPAHALVAPVHASIGTGYRAAGSHWSKGYHTGVDFLVPTGTAVHAVEAGQVVAAGWGGSYGYQVVIRHADGRYTQYGHLSAIAVRVGRHVIAGARIGRSGATGNVTGPHLHFEVRTGPGFGTDVDPLAYLRAHGVRI
ncbi:M23 family metallopeptidase [Streptomyces misionensis]|uniref:M23 family metallopeptidase n=1 Tax=Streptomyces misionensis TaxID=67331 RepID=A0A5C6K067_9ACTN|nr:M23 family metallopeptidase [Streptomyces misionensis]TWV56382.1 M23 family metallopeptidase [Streptomyces misionensis]